MRSWTFARACLKAGSRVDAPMSNASLNRSDDEDLVSSGPVLRSMLPEERDRVFMRAALRLARTGMGRTSPNPVVGAVVVKDGAIVGSGCHESYGAPHAERNALAQAGSDVRGATLYVTLEPCCIWGKTPPCTDAILEAGVARVVVPLEDPNPKIAGAGLALLREAGIEVTSGVLREEAEELNAPYLKYATTGMPLVVLKLALSLDGRVAGSEGTPRWVSSESSRARVHAMRARADCVMIGIGTLLEDDPQLTDRREGGRSRQPARLVLDRRLRTPVDSAVVRGAGAVETVIACGRTNDGSKRAELERAGVRLWTCPATSDGLDLGCVLELAASHGFIHVLCEGGPKVATALLKGGHVDRVAFFIAPAVFGASGVSAFGDLGRDGWLGRSDFDSIRWSEIDGDLLFEASVLRGA